MSNSNLGPVVVYVPPSAENEMLRRSVEASWDAMYPLVRRVEEQEREIRTLRLALAVSKTQGVARVLV